jgi:histidine ammonia-lyase
MTRSPRTQALALDGDNLSLADASRILEGHVAELSVTAAARKRVERARACLVSLLDDGRTLYGVNTGFGKLANQRIDPHDVLTLQENLLRSHAVGVGALLSPAASRLALALRIAALAKGFSGVTPDLLDALLELFNRGVVPAIPEQGSVGASGDLAPLAHLSLVVIGEGHAFVERGGRSASRDAPRNKPMSGRAALARVHLKPYRLQSKEGLSLINGTQISTAILIDALTRAWQLAKVADLAGAMTVEATKSSQRPFDPRIQAIRPHPGQAACARNLLRLLSDSEVMRSHADCSKVQDAYSMRCMPQVHGAVRDSLTHVSAVVEREMNSATDNPLVFADTSEVISGGNFHAQPVGYASDLLSVVLTDLSSISERRTENLVNPDLNGGLPGFLTPHPGLNSGLMIVQVLAAALVSENKSAAFPASVDSIPTSANREDHVSMAPIAARKARQAAINTTRVLACEVLCAAQGLDFHRPLKPGKAVEAAYQHVREHVRPLGRDRTMHRDVEAVERLIHSGSLLAAVESACGPLE